jgi:hypothetical protein
MRYRLWLRLTSRLWTSDKRDFLKDPAKKMKWVSGNKQLKRKGKDELEKCKLECNGGLRLLSFSIDHFCGS